MGVDGAEAAAGARAVVQRAIVREHDCAVTEGARGAAEICKAEERECRREKRCYDLWYALPLLLSLEGEQMLTKIPLQL